MKNDLDVKFTPFFDKQRKAAPLEIKEAFLETVLLLVEDEYHPALRNHPLKGKFAGYRSINVTEDWRALFKESLSGKKKFVTFHLLGTHKELYG
jgi:addiction module RelE/StbE family toxin